eukprot:760335-Hanusia_phi.AAC.2
MVGVLTAWRGGGGEIHIKGKWRGGEGRAGEREREDGEEVGRVAEEQKERRRRGSQGKERMRYEEEWRRQGSSRERQQSWRRGARRKRKSTKSPERSGGHGELDARILLRPRVYQ